jgi:hypothetical protein
MTIAAPPHPRLLATSSGQPCPNHTTLCGDRVCERETVISETSLIQVHNRMVMEWNPAYRDPPDSLLFGETC